jgi:hypothetical protein
MNFNYILAGITLLISLLTLYIIYNVNNNMNKLLLDDDPDDLEASAQRLSIIKYAKENKLKLNSLITMDGKQNAANRTIVNMLISMMKYIVDNSKSRDKNQADIKNDIDNMRDNVKVFEGRRRKDAEVQRSLLERIAKGLGGVPRAAVPMTFNAAAEPVARKIF